MKGAEKGDPQIAALPPETASRLPFLMPFPFPEVRRTVLSGLSVCLNGSFYAVALIPLTAQGTLDSAESVGGRRCRGFAPS